jgi:hypothetical protein
MNEDGIDNRQQKLLGQNAYFVGAEKPTMGANAIIMEADEESYCQNESPIGTANNRSKNHGGVGRAAGGFSLSPTSKNGPNGGGPVNLQAL